MLPPSNDGYSLPPRPQIDRQEVGAHFCTPRAGEIIRKWAESTAHMLEGVSHFWSSLGDGMG